MTRSQAASNTAWSRDTGDAVLAPTKLPLDCEVQLLLERGDTAGALRHVMECCGDSVYNFCCVVLNDRVLAEDVQQQTFLEAFRDLPRFQHRSSVRSWIFGIARHRVYDALKARRRTQARTSPGDIADELADEPDPRPQPDESVDAIRLRAALVASLRELREPVRIALVLRYQQGFTFEEIAEVCGDTAGTHHARVTRALRRLRADIVSRIQEPAAEDRPPGHDAGCHARPLVICERITAKTKMSIAAGKLPT